MQLSELKKGSHLEGDCTPNHDVIPDWLDWEKFERGRRFFIRHMNIIALSMHISLAAGLCIVNLLRPLVFTRKSDTAERAFDRYKQTFLHVWSWMTDDLWDSNSKGSRSIAFVRRMHRSVAKRMNTSPIGTGNHGNSKDTGNHGDSKDTLDRYISQYDMGLVQSGFFGAAIMYPEVNGISCTRQDLEDYIHVWRVFGFLLGIDDKYNICSGGYEETFNICKEIEQKLLIPALEDPPKEFIPMTQAYLDGNNLASGFRMWTMDSLMAMVYAQWGRPLPKLSFGDLVRYWVMWSYIWMIRWVPFFERAINAGMRLHIRALKLRL